MAAFAPAERRFERATAYGEVRSEERRTEMATHQDNTAESALTDLADDTVKLVAYTIVTLLRDHEDVMPDGEGTIVIVDSLTPEAFMAFIIAKYLQEAKLPKGELDKHRKYLRVHYVVSRRWPREPLKLEERQIDALHTIRDAIKP